MGKGARRCPLRLTGAPGLKPGGRRRSVVAAKLRSQGGLGRSRKRVAAKLKNR